MGLQVQHPAPRGQAWGLTQGMRLAGLRGRLNSTSAPGTPFLAENCGPWCNVGALLILIVRIGFGAP